DSRLLTSIPMKHISTLLNQSVASRRLLGVIRFALGSCWLSFAATDLRAQDGALDLQWLPYDAAGREIWTDNIGTFLLQPDGKILASSYYSFRAVTDSGLQSLSSRLLLRLNADGSLDSSFNPHIDAFATPSPNIPFGRAHAIAI